jgi:hypothetical protein
VKKYILILLLIPFSALFSFQFFFSSHTIIKGYIIDEKGSPINDVMVSYIDYQNFFRVFSDSLGHFNIKLDMSDEYMFDEIRSQEQIELCYKYMNSVSGSFFRKPNKEINQKMKTNIYDRAVQLTFRKLGMCSIILDTIVHCKMSDDKLPVNDIGMITMRSDSEKTNIVLSSSKEYYMNKIIYKDPNYWFNYKGTKYYACPGSQIGFNLINDMNMKYVSDDLLKLGHQANNLSYIGNYLALSGLWGGIIGALITKDNNRYYSISVGLLIYGSGLLIESKSRKLNKEFIHKYNLDYEKYFQY